MTHNEIHTLVDNSNAGDWHRFNDATAVYKPNIDVSLDWSETIKPSFSEAWHQNLPDPGASSVNVALRHNGTMVDRWTFIIVDGGRYILPIPEPNTSGGYELSSSMVSLGNLIFDLYRPGGTTNTLAALLKRCNITVV